MKKKWKIFWIVSVLIAGIGTVLFILGIAMGASVQEFRRQFPDGIGFHSTEKKMTSKPIKTQNAEEFAGIRKLDIEVTHMEVNMIPSEGENVRVETEELDSRLALRVQQRGEELHIETRENRGNRLRIKHGGILNVYLPYGMDLEETEVSVGGGRLHLDMEGIRSRQTDISIGAGEAFVQNIETEELGMDCGAGRIEAGGIKAHEVEADCGMGSIDLSVSGMKTDYNYTVECGMGTVEIGGDSFGGITAEKKIHNGQSSQHMDIECGMGSVSVEFEG